MENLAPYEISCNLWTTEDKWRAALASDEEAVLVADKVTEMLARLGSAGGDFSGFEADEAEFLYAVVNTLYA